MLPCFDLKKVVQSRVLQIKSQRFTKYHKNFPLKLKKNRPKYVRKGILSAFICSVRRFGDSLGRAEDSVCIWETPGKVGKDDAMC